MLIDRWFRPDGRARNISYSKACGRRPQALRVTCGIGRDTMFALDYVGDALGQYARAIDQLIEWRGGATEETRQRLLDTWPLFCDHYRLVAVPKTIYVLEQQDENA